MDFPQAWAFVRDTKPEQHDPKCSWRAYNGGFLCDCHVLNDEYDKRKAYEEFWSELSRQGDPERIPNKVRKGFNAGWDAAKTPRK